MRTVVRVALALCLFVAPARARADTTDQCISAAEDGQRLRRGARLRAARDAFIACAREACPGAIARDCKRWLDEVEASLPSVVLRVVDRDGRDVADASVTLDGKPVSPDGRPLHVDPGEHTLVAQRSGLSTRAPIVVAAGEHDRLVTIRLAERGDSGSVSSLTWVLGGAGILAVSTGVFFWVSGRDDRSELFATCGSTRTCTSEDKDAAQTKLVVGDVLVASGLVALGAAVFVGIQSSRAATASVRVGASPLAGGGLLVGAGRF